MTAYPPAQCSRSTAARLVQSLVMLLLLLLRAPGASGAGTTFPPRFVGMEIFGALENLNAPPQPTRQCTCARDKPCQVDGGAACFAEKTPGRCPIGTMRCRCPCWGAAPCMTKSDESCVPKMNLFGYQVCAQPQTMECPAGPPLIATAAGAALATPCFSGFGLPSCNQVVRDAGASGGWKNHSVWEANMPPNYSKVQRHPFCLQCCSARRDFYDELDGTWSMQCRPGTLEIPVPQGTAQGKLLTVTNPWTGETERIPLAAGVAPGGSFSTVFGAEKMPALRPEDQWQFRFRRRDTEDATALVYCNLTRTNRSRWIAGYELRLTVTEHHDTWSPRRWTSVDACSANALESATAPTFLTEQIMMKNAADPVATAVLALAYLVIALLAGLFVAWCFVPNPIAQLRLRCSGAKAKVYAT